MSEIIEIRSDCESRTDPVGQYDDSNVIEKKIKLRITNSNNSFSSNESEITPSSSLISPPSTPTSSSSSNNSFIINFDESKLDFDKIDLDDSKFTAEKNFNQVDSDSGILDTMDEMLNKLRQSFLSQITKDITFRKTQLRALERLLNENEGLLVEALQKDLRKSSFESIVTEIEFARNDIRCMLLNIDSWSKPESVSKSIITLFDSAYIQPEPYGVVLVIGAWNYPVQLTLCPLIGAITAGNCALVKPSEVSPATAQVLAELLPRYLNKDCYNVFVGGPEETKNLLKEKFDYVFFTGSSSIGRQISQSIAPNLTPHTLELGGKSPVFIDESIKNLEVACKRIIWGKCMNAGQTCVAPDYVLCTEKVKDRLVEALNKTIKLFFGDDTKSSQDFARIINDKHFQRLQKLLQSTKGTTIIGGKVDANEKYISPTIICDVQKDDPFMQEEIFGPILPMVTVKNEKEAIEYINSGEKPLSLYVFSTKNKVIDMFVNQTSSGSICGNDTVIHLSVDALPFGGVGASGVGAYHGRFSFDTFSHKKAILVRTWNPLVEMLGALRYPPYKKQNMFFLNQLVKKRQLPIPGDLSHYFMFLLGIGVVFIYEYFIKSA